MTARAHTRGEEPACFAARDRAPSFARGVAAAGMDLDGRAAIADTELDDPVRLRRPVPAPLFRFGLPLPKSGDLGVDALQPHRVPHPQGEQSRQVRRQFIEHIYDSRPVSAWRMLLPGLEKQRVAFLEVGQEAGRLRSRHQSAELLMVGLVDGAPL
ncbi:hypothetical protein [Streptomyces sp. NPDC127038]|uniref:hypothetical protein n=1 Tax=Streptomyces sp. NPDC127038 TaxID=3347114 RepID=UPI00364A9E8A